MICTDCPTTTPIISARSARLTLARLPDAVKLRARSLALAWLLERHVGLHVVEGIYGRPYQVDERVAISDEAKAVRRLRCPFFEGDRCIIGGLVPEPGRAPDYLFLPTAVLRLLDPPMLRAIVAHREVADAKAALLTRNEGFDLPTISTSALAG